MKFNPWETKLFFQKDGTPYGGDLTEQVNNWVKDFPNRYIKQSITPKGHHISTIWVGLDPSYLPGLSEGRPRIFETAIFNQEGRLLVLHRHRTQEEAIYFHDDVLDIYSKKENE